MKVFKYLVALADISVGFLGLFFVIFSVTRPSLSLDRQKLEQTVQRLRSEIRQLEEIKLAQSRHPGKALSGQDAGKIIVTGQSLVVELAGRQKRFLTLADFVAGAQGWSWPGSVVLYVDHRVPFEQVVGVIDALKSSNQEISVQIAALAR
jgi:biopolymer transport protein ExbD